MTINTDDLLNSILESIGRIHNVKSSELPDIELYMDQVTTFMEEKLRQTSRNPKEDKILTKTMINNYAKNDLLPPPEKKKYNKEHLVALIFIYYSKGFMSIQDIQAMLTPLTDRYFNSGKDIDLCSIYDEVFSMEAERTEELKEDICKKFERSLNTFTDVEGEDKEILQLFSFVFMLGYDVYTKKLLIEKLLDSYAKLGTTSNNESADKEKLRQKSKNKPSKSK